MKRIIIVIILFILCLGTSLYTTWRVQNTHDFMTSHALKAIEHIEARDQEALMEVIDDISDFWQEEEDRIIYYVRHQQIEDITKSVARLKSLAVFEDYSELCAELSSICWQMEHILRSEKNVFQTLP